MEYNKNEEESDLYYADFHLDDEEPKYTVRKKMPKVLSIIDTYTFMIPPFNKTKKNEEQLLISNTETSKEHITLYFDEKEVTVKIEDLMNAISKVRKETVN